MDKQLLMKADSKEARETALPSLPVQKLTLRVKTESRKKLRCGFYFYRNFLITLIVLYLLISISLLMLTIVAKAVMYLTSTPVLGGVAAAAAILFLVAIIGLIAIVKQHQIILFFFMVTLGFTSFICFCLSIACMSLPAYGQYMVLQDMWVSMGTAGKSSIQTTLNCCGFDASNQSIARGNPPCYSSDNTGPVCCKGENSTVAVAMPLSSQASRGMQLVYTREYCPGCEHCYPLWEDAIAKALYAAGAIGLVFSLTQILGIYMVYRYRHFRNPEINPYRNFI